MRGSHSQSNCKLPPSRRYLARYKAINADRRKQKRQPGKTCCQYRREAYHGAAGLQTFRHTVNAIGVKARQQAARAPKPQVSSSTTRQ
jgi:hypothetical protein